jgi:hypothetical protein
MQRDHYRRNEPFCRVVVFKHPPACLASTLFSSATTTFSATARWQYVTAYRWMVLVHGRRLRGCIGGGWLRCCRGLRRVRDAWIAGVCALPIRSLGSASLCRRRGRGSSCQVVERIGSSASLLRVQSRPVEAIACLACLRSVRPSAVEQCLDPHPCTTDRVGHAAGEWHRW